MPNRKIDDLELLDANTIAAGDLLLVRDVSIDDEDDEACKAIARSDFVAAFQPLDATLTALAGLTISANSIIVGTGADAFSVTAISANQIPGRSSTGNVVGKSCTDFGFSVIACADAAALRTAAGLGSAAVLAAGSANGVATLDGTGKVPTSQLPAAVLGAVAYQGAWNATTNSPTIPAAASGNLGHYYKVATAGSTDIDGITDWKVGDWIVSNGSTWDKIDNTDQVTSVAGRQGAVVITTDDVSAGAGTFNVPTVIASGPVHVGSGIDKGLVIDRAGFPTLSVVLHGESALQVKLLDGSRASVYADQVVGYNATSFYGVGDFTSAESFNGKQFRTDQTTLTYDATTDVDFGLAGCRTLSLTGDVTLTTSNRAASRTVLLRIIADGSTRTLAFPSWKWIGAMPTEIAASKTGVLSLTCFGTADTDVVAAFAVEE